MLQAFILGIIQGITEFLPVSSSTHLAFAKQLMGIEPNEWLIYFDLMCHFGTLFAVLAILWKDVWKVLYSPRLMALFTVALLPLIPAYFLLKPLRVLLSQDAGFFLLVTSAWMFLASSSIFASAPATATCQGRLVQTPEALTITPENPASFDMHDRAQNKWGAGIPASVLSVFSVVFFCCAPRKLLR